MSKRNFLTSFVLFAAILSPFLIRTSRKNACHTFFDYLLINFNGNCHYNPDVDLTVPEIVEKYTGNVIIYNLTTEDGYILQMFRIVNKNPIGVVLLQPPISAGSIAYLSDNEDSLAIQLWKQGYDIWLSNHRGSAHSRGHVNLTEDNPEYWNFGFHEIAIYDLAAQLKLINDKTKSKVTYIGYSMAATEGLIYASVEPEEAEKYVGEFVLIAPVARMKHYSSISKYLLYAMSPFEEYLRSSEFLTLEALRWAVTDSVTVAPYVVNIMTSMIMGWTPTELDAALYPYIFAHHGRGIATQMIYHYGQIYLNQSHFPMYDYGTEVNSLKYGSATPPQYNLQNVRNPVYVIYGEKDAIATPSDIQILCDDLLPKGTISGMYLLPNHNHVDFFFSKHRRNKVYRSILSIFDKIQGNKNKI